MRIVGLVVTCLVVIAVNASSVGAQDGASYDPRAKSYAAPATSLAGAPDTPERNAAVALLWQGKLDDALSKLKQLAENGDVASALLLGGVYQTESKLPVSADPLMALHFYTLASQEGSGEASERIAEMIEKKQISVTLAKGDPEFWWGKARQQGWNQQKLSAYCYDWTHGPEPLHCERSLIPGAEADLPAEVQPQCPTEKEMASLRSLGMTGMIHQNGGALRLDSGPRARAILILDHVVPGEADLKEPDAASVIYIQTRENRWKMLPTDAPLLNRFLILKPNSAGMGRMALSAQAVDGSQSGGACSQF